MFDSHSLEVRIYNTDFDLVSTLHLRIDRQPKMDQTEMMHDGTFTVDSRTVLACVSVLV